MTKEQEAGVARATASAPPLPSAPPSYDQAMSHPYNPHVAAPVQAVNPPYQYQPVPVVHETAQGTPAPYPVQQFHPVRYPGSHATVVTQETVVLAGPLPVGRHPLRTTCPNCQKQIVTSIEVEYKCMAHLCCLLLFMGACCLCSCLPYFMDSMKFVKHTCPGCKAYLGTYKATNIM